MVSVNFFTISVVFASLNWVSTEEINATQQEKLLFYQYDKETNTSALIANESTPEIYGLTYDIANGNNIITPIFKENQDSEDFPDSMNVNCKSDFKILSCGTFSLVGCTRYKRFYAESSLKMNWYDSWELCRSHGMILASIESRYEQHILETYLVEKDTVREDSALKPYWTSGTNFGRGSPYFWLATGKDFSSSFNYFLKDELKVKGMGGIRDTGNTDTTTTGCVKLMISSDSSTSDYWDVSDCSAFGFTLCQM